MEDKDRLKFKKFAIERRQALYNLLKVLYLVFIFFILKKIFYGLNFILGEILGVLVILGIYFMIPISLVNYIQTVLKYKNPLPKEFKTVSEKMLILIIISLMIISFVLGFIINL